MSIALTVLVVLAVVVLLVLALSVRIVKQYEQGVLFRFGRLIGVRGPGWLLASMSLVTPEGVVNGQVDVRS